MIIDLFDLITGETPGGTWTAGKCDGSGNASGPAINPDGHTVTVDCFAPGIYDYSYSQSTGNCEGCTETQLEIVDKACLSNGEQINFCNTRKNGVCTTTKVSGGGTYNSGTRVLSIDLRDYTIKCCTAEPYPDLSKVRWSLDAGVNYGTVYLAQIAIPDLCPPTAPSCAEGFMIDKNYCVKIDGAFNETDCFECANFNIDGSPLLTAPECDTATNNHTFSGDSSCIDVRQQFWAYYPTSVPVDCRTVLNPPANTVITFHYRDKAIGGAFTDTTTLDCVDLSAFVGKDVEFYYTIEYTFPNADVCGVESDICYLHICDNPLGCLEVNCEYTMCRIEHVNLQDIADIPVGFRTGKWTYIGSGPLLTCTGNGTGTFSVDGATPATFFPGDIVKNSWQANISTFAFLSNGKNHKFLYSVTVDGCTYSVLVCIHVTICCDNECTTITVNGLAYRDYKYLDKIVFENQSNGTLNSIVFSPRANTCDDNGLDAIEAAIQAFYISKGETDIEVCARGVMEAGNGSDIVSRSNITIFNWDCWKPHDMDFYQNITGGSKAVVVQFSEECDCDICSGNITQGTYPPQCGDTCP